MCRRSRRPFISDTSLWWRVPTQVESYRSPNHATETVSEESPVPCRHPKEELCTFYEWQGVPSLDSQRRTGTWSRFPSKRPVASRQRSSVSIRGTRSVRVYFFFFLFSLAVRGVGYIYEFILVYFVTSPYARNFTFGEKNKKKR